MALAAGGGGAARRWVSPESAYDESVTQVELWLTELDVPVDDIRRALKMGARKPSDLQLFPMRELIDEFHFNAASASTIWAYFDEHRQSSKPTEPRSMAGSDGRPDLRSTKPAAQKHRVRAKYSFAAVQPSHLNAEMDEEFDVLDSRFEWWKCQARSGEVTRAHAQLHACQAVLIRHQVGLLPSNYLVELISTSTDGTGKHSKQQRKQPDNFEDVHPTWLLRKQVKELCEQALADVDLKALTYIRMKKTLVNAFGRECFDKDKEHVKEMLRRTEDKLHHRFNQTQQMADIVLEAAAKQRDQAVSQSKPEQKAIKPQFAPPSNGLFTAEADRVAKRGLDPMPPLPPTLPPRKYITDDGTPHTTKSDDSPYRLFQSNESEIPSAERPYMESRMSDTSVVPIWNDGNAKSNSTHAVEGIAAPDSGSAARYSQPKDLSTSGSGATYSEPRHLGRSPQSSWTGGYFKKRGDGAGGKLIAAFSSSLNEKRRWLQPTERLSIAYFTERGDANPKGEIPLNGQPIVYYPAARPLTILITPDGGTREYDLTAENESDYNGLRDYITFNVNALTTLGTKLKSAPGYDSVATNAPEMRLYSEPGYGNTAVPKQSDSTDKGIYEEVNRGRQIPWESGSPMERHHYEYDMSITERRETFESPYAEARAVIEESVNEHYTPVKKISVDGDESTIYENAPVSDVGASSTRASRPPLYATVDGESDVAEPAFLENIETKQVNLRSVAEYEALPNLASAGSATHTKSATVYDVPTDLAEAPEPAILNATHATDSGSTAKNFTIVNTAEELIDSNPTIRTGK